MERISRIDMLVPPYWTKTLDEEVGWRRVAFGASLGVWGRSVNPVNTLRLGGEAGLVPRLKKCLRNGTASIYSSWHRHPQEISELAHRGERREDVGFAPELL
jgi:hypothetical protein